MQIQVNTDRNIEGGLALDSWTTAVVEAALGHLGDHLTRVDVHLGDENGNKSGAEDKRCLMEARLIGRPPIAVTAHADSLHAAINGASRKLVRAIEHELGRADRRAHEAGAMPADEPDAAEASPLSQPNS